MPQVFQNLLSYGQWMVKFCLGQSNWTYKEVTGIILERTSVGQVMESGRQRRRKVFWQCNVSLRPTMTQSYIGCRTRPIRYSSLEMTSLCNWRYVWSSQLYTQLKQLRNWTEPGKNSGLNGIRTHDLCDTGAVLYQLSYQAKWELVILWVRNIPVEDEEYKWIYESSYIWTAENEMKIIISISQLLKLSVWLRWSNISSFHSPQFKYMNFHIFTCIICVTVTTIAKSYG